MVSNNGGVLGMSNIELKEVLLAYDKPLLYQWKQGNIDMLLNSSAPGYCKKIIQHKKREESKRRYQAWYFGESYVAAQKGDTVKYGWFNSYHWLAEEEWANENYVAPREKFAMDEELKTEFNQALLDNIGLKLVKKIQTQVNILYDNFKKDLKYSKPKAPDLWFIDKNGKHHFIEVKMRPQDTAKNHQVAGLVVLYKCLNASVKVVRIYERHKLKPEAHNYSAVFNKYFSFLKN
jgi:hypothetical protein